MMAHHFQSSLNRGTKKPKKKVVQEKPIGHSFFSPLSLFKVMIIQVSLAIVPILIDTPKTSSYNLNLSIIYQ